MAETFTDKSFGVPSFQTLSDADIANLQNGQILAYNATTGKWYNRTTLPATAGVDSIGPSGYPLTGSIVLASPSGTLTPSVSGQNLYIDINLSHANTWTGVQSFPAASIPNTTLAGPLVTGITTSTAAGITLTASGSGVGAYAYIPSVHLGGDLSGSSLAAATVSQIQGVPLTLTSLASGNVLRYNGTAFVNVAPSTFAVTGITAGTGISISGTTGQVTVSNSGVTSLAAGTGISVSSSTGAITLTNTGVTSAVAGTNITVSSATGSVTIGTSLTPSFTNVTLAGVAQLNGTAYSGTSPSVFSIETYTTAGALQTAFTINGLSITTGVWQATPISNTYLAGPLVTSLTTETAAGITLTASGSGVGAYAYTPSVTLGGDISGTSLEAVTVSKISGVPVVFTTITTGNFLYYNGTDIVNQSLAAGTGITISDYTITNAGVTSAEAGTNITVSAATGAVTFATVSNPTFTGLVTAEVGVAFTAIADSSTAGKLFLSSTTANTLKFYDTQTTPALHILMDSLNINSYAVTQVTAGTGISVTGTTGTVTIANTGVTSFQGLTGAVTLTAGTGIGINSTTISNTGVTSIAAGTNITVSGSTGGVTVGTTTTPSFTSVTLTNVAQLSGTAYSSTSDSVVDLQTYTTAGALQTALTINGLNITTGVWQASPISNAYLAGPLVTGLATETAAGITLTANGSGVGVYSYTPSVSLGGDLSGSSLGAATVARISGVPVSFTTIASGDFLYYNGTDWVNQPLAGGTGISVSGATITNTGIISLSAGSGISVSGTNPATITNTGVTSISNTDGTLTISPTTGGAVASLNLSHSNTWTAVQSFNRLNANEANIASGSGGTEIIALYGGLQSFPTSTTGDMYGFGISGSTMEVYASDNFNFWQLGFNVSTPAFSIGGKDATTGTYSLVKTAHNTLDDGSGNMSVSGTSTAATVSATSNFVIPPMSNSSGNTYYMGTAAWSGDAPGGTGNVAGIVALGDTGSQLFTISSGPAQMSFQLDGSIFVGDGAFSYNPFGTEVATDGSILANGDIAAGGRLGINGAATFNSGITVNGSTNIVMYANAATSTTTTVSSGHIDLLGSIWNGSASVPSGYRIYSDPNSGLNIDLNANGELTSIVTISEGGISILTGGITGSGTTGTLTAGPGILGTANSWTALQTFGTAISILGARFSGPTPTTGQIIQYNGTNWVAATPNVNTVATLTAHELTAGTYTWSPSGSAPVGLYLVSAYAYLTAGGSSFLVQLFWTDPTSGEPESYYWINNGSPSSGYYNLPTQFVYGTNVGIYFGSGNTAYFSASIIRVS